MCVYGVCVDGQKDAVLSSLLLLFQRGGWVMYLCGVSCRGSYPGPDVPEALGGIIDAVLAHTDAAVEVGRRVWLQLLLS
jgi:hypothetical protein